MEVDRYALCTKSGQAMSNEWGDRVRDVLKRHSGPIGSALRAAVGGKGLDDSGKLKKGFRPSIAEKYGDPYALRFSMPRYGYILNAGRNAMEVTDSTNNRRYEWTKAIPKHGFVDEVLEGSVNKLANDLQKAGADAVVKVLNMEANKSI